MCVFMLDLKGRAQKLINMEILQYQKDWWLEFQLLIFTGVQSIGRIQKSLILSGNFFVPDIINALVFLPK